MKAKISLLVICFSQYFIANNITNIAHIHVAIIHHAPGHALSQNCIRNAIISIITNTIQLKI